MVNLVQQLHLPNEVRKQDVARGLVVRDVLLANKVLVDLRIMKQHRLAAGSLAKLPDEGVVASSQERDQLVRSYSAVRHAAFRDQ